MPVIRILPHAEYCPQGDTIEADRGTSICEALLENGIAIEHACEMSCACTTCHVIVREGLRSLGEAGLLMERDAPAAAATAWQRWMPLQALRGAVRAWR